MRCVSFCTAANYRLDALGDYFRRKRYLSKLYRNVLYVTKPGTNWGMYFFNHGCFVTWGLKKREEQHYIDLVKQFSVEPLEKIEIDYFIYYPSSETKIKTHGRFNADLITIDEAEAENPQVKLAISYGLAQSVKLGAYEESVQKTIVNNKPMPIELAKYGRISLSRKAISKRIGEIFLERSSVNLSSEYLEVPEYFWQYANLEAYYIMTEKFLDIPKRVASLNRKLDVLHGIFEVLNDQLQHRYSSILEFTIIILIVMEIVLSFFHKV